MSVFRASPDHHPLLLLLLLRIAPLLPDSDPACLPTCPAPQAAPCCCCCGIPCPSPSPPAPTTCLQPGLPHTPVLPGSPMLSQLLSAAAGDLKQRQAMQLVCSLKVGMQDQLD